MSNQYLIIDDGQFMYAVLAADVAASGETLASLKAMDADEYGLWSGRITPVGDYEIGTTECIDYCESLIELGATKWVIA
jgi:hypothetical protein